MPRALAGLVLGVWLIVGSTGCARAQDGEGAEAPAADADSDSAPAVVVPPLAEFPGAPVVLPPAPSRDVPAEGKLFERGIPVTAESFSPDGFHFAHLFQIRGGFPRRRPERCAFLLDLATGENRPAKTPAGQAARIGGWDPTGRYLLVESQKPDFLSALTDGLTTYHWIFDTVTDEYVSRKAFTGRRDDERFLWKRSSTYHGVWAEDGEPVVVPLFDGELAERFRSREETWDGEDDRRTALARRLALTTDDGPTVVLADVLARLDDHWTRRGHRDPIVSETFGARPGLRVRHGDDWQPVMMEVDFLAVLDHSLCLVTVAHGQQYLYHADRNELLPLNAPPEAWATSLDHRWERSTGTYDERDPLPRDLQYRRSTTAGRGTAHYYNYVLPGMSRVLLLYCLGPEERVLRIVDLPASWRDAD
ncbi:MAG TPA: hypothetical protein VKU85_03740 [bacterium]|nr:hypothetical protein [bacterium]